MRLSISRWNLVCLLAFGAGLGPACTVTTGGDDDPFDASTSDDFDTDDTDTDDTDTDDTDTDDTDTDDTDTDDTDTDEPAEPDASPPTDGSVPPPVDGSVAPNDASTPDSGTTCGEGMCCDAGACGAEDAAAADGGCTPYEPDVASSGDAGAPACFPSCVAELQARCMPAGECGVSTDLQNTCWDNGVTRKNGFDPETFSVATSMFAGGASCYQVLITSDDAGNTHYSWQDSCGVEIASGDALVEDLTQLTVTCAGSSEQTTVDLIADECLAYSEGAPLGMGCGEAPSCGAQ